nr:glycine zipper family protein [uncultured Anaeromusa sp.]
MNYMRELNAFRNWAMINRPSTGGVALWNMLMNVNNMTGWKEWFTVPNQTLQLLTGLSRQGIESTRNSLIQFGLIEYKKGRSNQAGSYRMISLLFPSDPGEPVDNFSECKNLGTALGTVVGIDVGTPGGTLIGTGVGTVVGHSYTKLYVDEKEKRKEDVPNSQPVDKSLCEKCGGKGYVVVKVPFNNGLSLKDSVVPCECRKQKTWGVPEQYQHEGAEV